MEHIDEQQTDRYQNCLNLLEFWRNLKEKQTRAWEGREPSRFEAFAMPDTRAEIEKNILPTLYNITFKEFWLAGGGADMDEEDVKEIQLLAEEIKYILCAYTDAMATMFCQYGLTCQSPLKKSQEVQ